MGWKECLRDQIIEVAKIGQSSGSTSYIQEFNLKNKKLSPHVPSLDLQTSLPPRTVISQFEQTVYTTEVDFPYQNAVSARVREGRVKRLQATIRDGRIIMDLISNVLFKGKDELEYLSYMVGGVEYKLKQNTVQDNYPNIVVIDDRGLPSTLRGSFSREMEDEFRRLPDLCEGITFDLEHCLEFLKEGRR